MTRANSIGSRRHRNGNGTKHRAGILPASAGTRTGWLLGLALLAGLLWSYWQAIVSLWKDWQASEEYSVGQLVPLVALYLVWRERAALRRLTWRPCWWGLGLILLAQAARAAGLLYLFESAERYSLVLSIAGLVLLVAGWQVFRHLRWVLVLLVLMVPLPGRVHNFISGPLQTAAARGGFFLLEVIGVTVTREGNVLVVNHTIRMGIAEACSGLRMLTAFLLVSATFAFLVHRPRWQKAVLLASSIPIGIVSNMARLCVTAVLYVVASSETAQLFFHDGAGYAMMPLAVGILAAELWLMNKLVVPEEAPLSSVGRNGQGGQPSGEDSSKCEPGQPMAK